MLWKEVAEVAKTEKTAKRKKRSSSEDVHIYAQKDAKKRAFLSAYARLGNITSAAESAKIARRTHYLWMDTDPDYVEAFEQAQEAFADMLEREAVRRAVEGVEQTIFHKGKPVGKRREYSDTLLIFTLKGTRPDKYKDRQATELTGAGGKDLRVEFVSPERPGEAGGA